MVDRSSGANYQPPEWVLSDETLQRLIVEADQARTKEDRLKILAKVLAKGAGIGLIAYNPAIGVPVDAMISQLIKSMEEDSLDEIDSAEFAHQIAQMLSAFESSERSDV